MKRQTILAALSVLAILTAAGAKAEDFYDKKQVHLIVGHEPGGDYDVGARLLAKYLPKHIPGHPTIIVQDMPGAASILAANYLYNVAPKDGTVFGSFSRNLPSQAVLGQANIRADPRRFNWLGATSFPSRVCVSATSAAVKTPEDLFKHELITAGAGAGSSLSIIPTVLNKVMGTKFRLVEGYKGSPDALLALQAGEVEAICQTFVQFKNSAELFTSGKARVLFNAEEQAMPDHPGVPTIFSYVKNDEQVQLLRFIFSSTQFGRPYVFPPEVPKDRVEIMRTAFRDALHDPDLVAEAEKLNIDMTYSAPGDLVALVNKLFDTQPQMIEKAKDLVPAGVQ